MNLLQISNLEQAMAILTYWWDRPSKIAKLRHKFPDQEERIKQLWLIATLRKNDAITIEIFFMKNPDSGTVCLKLNS